MSSHSLADNSSLSRYVDFLLNEGQYENAVETLNGYVGGREGRRLASGNLVFNPGFEYEPLGTALDWRIRESKQFKTERDSQVARTGSCSLQIRFGGQENVHYRHLAQKVVVVRPGRYRFQVHARIEGITTDQGVGFRTRAADGSSGVDIRTEPLLGTTDWTLVEKSFSVPPRTKLLEIQAFRRGSRKFDSKISGAVWIDDLSLVAL